MKKLFVLLPIVCLMGYSSYFKLFNEVLQKGEELIFIKNYPVKIDGRASFYIYYSISLDNKMYILVISKDKQAFIQTSRGFIYFKHRNREVTEKGYKDFYSNKQTLLILNIIHIQKAGAQNSIRSGTVELKGTESFLFKIHGIAEEYDNYNYPDR